MDDEREILAADEVPADGTVLFRVDGDDGVEEAILVRIDGEVVAYKNYCQHWTDVRLDKGSGAMVRNGEIVCQKHAATFEAESGYCNFGPCEGSYLETLDTEVREGVVYLADDGYTLDGLGPSEDTPQSSGNRIDFTGS